MLETPRKTQMPKDEKSTEFHILVAVGAESQLKPLLSLGYALASTHDGHVTLLTVTAQGERPAWLAIPEGWAAHPIEIRIRPGVDPAEEILEFLREERADMLILGWRGQPGKGRYLVGQTLDPLVQRAPCDVIVVSLDADRPPLTDPTTAKRILVPVSGGPNAGLALELALALAPEAEITALYIARSTHGQMGLSYSREQMEEILEPWSDEPRIRGEVVQASGVRAGILAQAAKEYDLLLIGSSQESYLDRVLFGNIPQSVAARSPIPSIITRRYVRGMRMGTRLRRLGGRLYQTLPTLDLHEQIEVYKSIREGAEPKADFFIMIGLASAIATFGLLQNSPAVIIGAMLVAPLMAAMFGLSLGIVRGDLRLLRRAGSATLRGLLLAVAVGVLLGWLMPSATPESEILNRTTPNLLDLGVALASGAAGAYALSRKGVSTSLPGVAIAAALVPPLATIGIGLALGDGRIAGGASLLFLTNLVAITAAGGLVFLWLGFRPIPGQLARVRVFQGSMLGTILLLIAVTIPLGALTVQSIHEGQEHRALDQAVREEVAKLADVELVEWTILPDENDNHALRLEVRVRCPRTISHREAVELQENVAGRLQQPVALLLSVVPTTRLDPFVPPTPTPSPMPGASPTPTFTPTSTSPPTTAPTLTPTSSATPTPTDTLTPTPSQTPTATETDTPTVTPTATPILAQVGGTGGMGVWMYQQPGLMGGKIGALRDGTVLTVIGGPVKANGYNWIQVIDPQSRLGWIPDRYLIRLAGH